MRDLVPGGDFELIGEGAVLIGEAEGGAGVRELGALGVVEEGLFGIGAGGEFGDEGLVGGEFELAEGAAPAIAGEGVLEAEVEGVAVEMFC